MCSEVGLKKRSLNLSVMIIVIPRLRPIVGRPEGLSIANPKTTVTSLGIEGYRPD